MSGSVRPAKTIEQPNILLRAMIDGKRLCVNRSRKRQTTGSSKFESQLQHKLAETKEIKLKKSAVGSIIFFTCGEKDNIVPSTFTPRANISQRLRVRFRASGANICARPSPFLLRRLHVGRLRNARLEHTLSTRPQQTFGSLFFGGGAAQPRVTFRSKP